MAQTDLHEKLCGFYEFMLGTVPNRDEFIAALRQTLTEDDIRVIFLLPFTGEITWDRFVKKAAKINLSPEELEKIIRRLVPEGFIATYVRSQERDFAGRAYPSTEPLISVHTEGRVFARGEIISMTEMQVRKPEHDPMRNAAAHWMDAMIEGSGITMPTKTPYYRIIPKEPTLPKEPRRTIQVGEKIEDPRAVLPFDVVSKMVRNERVMAVADCYCRRTKIILGEGCDCPTETCMYFNELAALQINAGRARRIDHEEAIQILKKAADAGLIHSVSNCEGHINCICNCCVHACGIMKSMAQGHRNAGGVSRYQMIYSGEGCDQCGICVEVCPMNALSLDGDLHHDEQRCIGCGSCVYKCPTECLSMTWRESPPKIYRDAASLTRQLTIEAAVGLVKRKITGGQ
jgi:NAD-dependent dihydropyrimidine dehydrogenase PreA subunit/DNA-binding Lrp family transcriptional regulator